MNSIFSNNLNTQNNSGVFGGTLFNNGFSGFGSQSGTLSNGFSSSNGLFGGNYGGSFFSGFGNSGFNGFGGTFGSYGNNFWGFGNGGSTSTGGTTNTPSTPNVPAGPSIVVNATEDTVFSFGSDNFVLETGEEAAQVRIISLPSNGVLTSGGLTVSVGDYLDESKLDTLIYTPTLDAFGTDSFTVVMSEDGSSFEGGESSVTISVLGVPEAPTATALTSAIQVSESSAVEIGEQLIATYIDVDGDALVSVTINSVPSSGALTHSCGTAVAGGDVLTASQAASLVYTPSAPAGSTAVPDGFNYTFSDGTLSSSTVSFPLSIIDGNDAPTFTSGTVAYTLPENDMVTLTSAASANANDTGDTLSYSISGADASRFAVNANTGEIRFVSEQDFENPTASAGGLVYTVNLIATDSGGLTALQEVSITLTDVANENTPVFSGVPSTISMDENETDTGIDLAATDSDGDTLTYSLDNAYGDNAKFTITADELLFQTAPDADVAGDTSTTVSASGDNVYDVEVSVSDGANITKQLVSVVVNAIEDNPVVLAALGAGSTVENTTETGIVANATDGDADSTPGSSITYSLTNGYGDNHLFEVASDGTLSFKTAPDFEDAQDTAAIAGSSSVTPFNNVYEVQVEASDGTNESIQSTTVTVTNADDDAPVFDDPIARNVNENAAIGDNVGAVLTRAIDDTADIKDANTIVSYAITAGNTGNVFTIDNAGQVTVAGALDHETTDSYELTIQATDALGNVGDGVVTVSVDDVDDAPEVSGYSQIITEDGVLSLGSLTTIAGFAGYSDAEGEAATEVTLLGLPSSGAISDGSGDVALSGTIGTNTWTYTPDPNFYGTDSFEIAISDGMGDAVGGVATLSETIEVTVTVEAVNERPVLNFTGSEIISGVPTGFASNLSLSTDLLPLDTIGSNPVIYKGAETASILGIGSTSGEQDIRGETNNKWNPIDLEVTLGNGSNQPVLNVNPSDVDSPTPTTISVQQYEILDNAHAGWAVTGSNGWVSSSPDFSVDSSGVLRFTDATSNGTFSAGDEVLLAIQATDSSGLISDYFMVDITFA